jgi:preprotein translocase subunit SecA
VQIRSEEQIEEVAEQHPAVSNVQYQHADYDEALATAGAPAEKKQLPFENNGLRVGRNDACPCGSGKKYKQCHGALA